MQREVRVLKKKTADLEAQVQKLQVVDAENAKLKKDLEDLNAQLAKNQSQVSSFVHFSHSLVLSFVVNSIGRFPSLERKYD
jgi:uncharacterized protein YigA (DUF484 family)